MAQSARTGAAVFKTGKLHAAEVASGEEVLEASLHVVHELAFTLEQLENDDPDNNRWSLHIEDDRGWKHRINIDQRTENLTKLQIDVGLFGSEAVAREIYSRIQTHLRSHDEAVAADASRPLHHNPHLQ